MTRNPVSGRVSGIAGSSSRTASSTVGRFHWGTMRGHEPIALPTWRVTALAEDVAAGVAGILGGELRREVVSDDHLIELMTNISRVDLEIYDVADCYGDTRLYGLCEMDGAPCVTSELSAVVRGSRPYIRLRFSLAEDPALGLFEFHGSSWALARDLAPVLDALGGRSVSAAHCALSIEASWSPRSRDCRSRAMPGPRLRLLDAVTVRGPER
ncbi:hypothetical protein [Streptomyces sp. NPDC046909]|uniref:recombination directionality factor n=1 Tax=Streptomyces sp. NPDC046909 TaxID=3155617 RepID=UPI0033F846BF